MRIRIEVEWDPQHTVMDDPDEAFLYAEQRTRIAAINLADSFKSRPGVALITETSVER